MVLGDFGSKCSKISCTNDRKSNTHNSAIVNHEVDAIILQENNKVSAESESHENIDFEIDENNLYHIDNMSLDEN